MAVIRNQAALAAIHIINISTSLISVFMDLEPTPKPPFRTVWNYPDKPCRSGGIDFKLADYSIESNKEEFIEDTIALYYSSLIGKWPFFEFGNDTDFDEAIHGGWPHNMNMAAHVLHVQEVISQHQSPSANGFGVIDMELWRPILRTNYGKFSPYRQKYVDHMASRYPHLETKEHKAKADEMWAWSTKLLMSVSLAMAKVTRPLAKWGYYGYPERVTAPDNHQLKWLWESVTAFYPSIYIKNFTRSFDEVEENIKASIAEAFRVRALYGNPDHPIMAYQDVQSLPEENREEWLRLALQVPIDMGADGIILWASSKHFRQGSGTSCLQIQEYVQNTIGPYISDLTKYLTKCSTQLCTDRGRCVRKTYAKSIPFLVTRGVKRSKGDGVEEVEPLLYRKIYAGFKRDYMCQCYTGWAGKRCVEKAQ